MSSNSDAVTLTRLRLLLRRCASGSADFPECPICLTKWCPDEERQPHSETASYRPHSLRNSSHRRSTHSRSALSTRLP